MSDTRLSVYDIYKRIQREFDDYEVTPLADMIFVRQGDDVPFILQCFSPTSQEVERLGRALSATPEADTRFYRVIEEPYPSGPSNMLVPDKQEESS